MVYEPAEDSVLLAKAVKKYAKGSVLDMGTGSGYLAQLAASLESVDSVLGADLDPEAIAFCKKNVKDSLVSFRHTDLFSAITESFDTIIFNPPYLPKDKEFHDIALHGGKRGYETICAFLEQAGDHLSPSGKILLLFSSLSKQEKILECLDQNLFEYKPFTQQHVFFEDLFVYVIRKRKVRKAIEKKGVKHLKYFDHGKRGLIFTGKYKGKKVAVKVKRDESAAIERISNEAKWLAHLQDTKMCPHLITSSDLFLIYEFVEGTFLPEFLAETDKDGALSVLLILLDYCRTLDILQVNKEEMTRPIKHVLVKTVISKWSIRKKVAYEVKMLDFERCTFSQKPQNVTQFVQYLTKTETKKRLRGKVKISSTILDKAKTYKKEPTDEHYQSIARCLS